METQKSNSEFSSASIYRFGKQHSGKLFIAKFTLT